MLLALLFVSGSAWAGSYTVTYSGGTITTTTDGNAVSAPYGFRAGIYGAWNYCFWGTKNNGTAATTSSVVCSGTITATFTWNGDDAEDLPPKVAVVRENCGAAWDSYADIAAIASGTSNNDLGFDYVQEREPDPDATVAVPNGYSKGTRYKIQEDPGESFSITSSPSINVMGTGSVGPPEANGYARADMIYQAGAEPLEVILDGGIGPKDNKKFLIGQHVDASVVTGDLTADSYNWTVSGGKPFKNYTADSSNAVFTPLGSETGSSMGFYFAKPLFDNEIAQVSCIVHLVVPPGSLPAAGLNATPYRQCGVNKPFNSLSAWTGSTQGYPNSTTPQAMRFYGALYGGYQAGILWSGVVTTPPEYGYGGGWNYTQLVTTHRMRRVSGVMQHQSYNGLQALDTTFGYDPVFPSLYPDDGSEHVQGDSPSTPLDSSMSYAEVLDSFLTYTLYRPPGQDSRFVPLKDLNWFWEGEAVPIGTSGSLWSIYNTNGGWSFLEDFPDHPEWERNITGTQYVP